MQQYQLAGVPLPEPAGRPRRGEPVPRSGEQHRTARVTCVGRWAAGRTGERRSRGRAWRGGWSGWWCRSAGLQCSAVHSHAVQGGTEAGHRQPRPGEEQVVLEDGVESEEGGELHGETAGPGLGRTARQVASPLTLSAASARAPHPRLSCLLSPGTRRAPDLRHCPVTTADTHQLLPTFRLTDPLACGRTIDQSSEVEQDSKYRLSGISEKSLLTERQTSAVRFGERVLLLFDYLVWLFNVCRLYNVFVPACLCLP